MAVTSEKNGRQEGGTGRREFAEIEAAASTPNPRNDQLYAQLLDQVIGDLAAQGAEPTEALGAAGRAVKGTAWAGYRNGRARLASAAAAYLTWLAPPEGWKHCDAGEVAGRHPIGWQSPSGEVIVDVLGGGQVYTRIIRQVRGLRPDAACIRVLDLLAPRRSMAFPLGSTAVPLVD